MIKLSCTKQVHVFVCAGNQVYQNLYDKVLLCMCWVMCKIIEIKKKTCGGAPNCGSFTAPFSQHLLNGPYLLCVHESNNVIVF